MSDLKLNIVNENTGETILRTIIRAILSEMGLNGVSQEEIQNAVSAYMAEHPIDTLSESDVTEIISQYMAEHPIEGVSTEDVQQMVDTAVNALDLSGLKGDTGATPNITATASIDNTTGTPSVNVSKSGTDENPIFSFAFSGIKGADGNGSVSEEQIAQSVNQYIEEHPIENLNTDNIEVVHERTIYDINHIRITTPEAKFENGVYTLVAPKTGNKWSDFKVDDADLKSSNGIAKLKIHIAEISGAWRFFIVFKNRNNEPVYMIGDTNLITETGDLIYDIDINYLSVYKNYNGTGINLAIANYSSSTDETTYKIVIDEYNLITEGITTSGDNLTDVIKNLSSGASGTGTIIQANDNKLSASNGDKYILQVDNNGVLKTIPVIPSNILYIGNSALVGFGNHGMASTTVEDDYFYKINHWITGQGKTLNITDKLSASAFEGCTTDEAVNTWITKTLAPRMNNDRELVIIQLGDNVNTSEKLAEFNKSCGVLSSFIRENCPNARVCWLSMWFASEAKMEIVKKACKKYGCVLVDIHDLSGSELYRNHIGATYIDSNGNEQTITESGVASHPNDLGFTKIAKRVVEQLFDGEYVE